MKQLNGKMCFGFFQGMPYGIVTDTISEMETLKNTINRSKAVDYIERLPNAIACAMSTDIYTGKEIDAGIYTDGDFVFPIDFLRYYKQGKIGMPHEYEKYISNRI